MHDVTEAPLNPTKPQESLLFLNFFLNKENKAQLVKYDFPKEA